MIKLDKVIIVEGKYDKIRLANLLDATIITTNGFGIFKDTEKIAFIKLMAEKKGLVILTDSDHAGQLIRKHVEKIAGKNRVTHVYLPQLLGKEKRKNTASAEGFLGVEGTPDDIILSALSRAGLCGEKTEQKGRQITKTDLFNLGLSGTDCAKENRESLLLFLNLPKTLPANSMLDALNTLYSFEEFNKEVLKWKQG